MLGYDPMFLACEGRVVAIVNESIADIVLSKWQAVDNKNKPSIIGQIDKHESKVILMTEFGGERILEELEDDPLPRIC